VCPNSLCSIRLSPPCFRDRTLRKHVAAAGFEPATKGLSEPATCPRAFLLNGIFFYFSYMYNVRVIRGTEGYIYDGLELDKNQPKV
jgi:hypothetical protein